MSDALAFQGSLPSVIRNDDRLYEGDLTHYFRVVFHHAQNVFSPYHNFRHMSYVPWLAYQACAYYAHTAALTPRQMRHLLIAGLFHDFDHPGTAGNDDLNITRSIRGLEKHVLPSDAPFLHDVTSLIRFTEYPYKAQSGWLPLSALILRDADLAQAMSTSWIQHVVFGLAAEWRKQPIDVLAMQEAFLGKLEFQTEWAKQAFPQSEIDGKIAEAKGLLELLR